jgi:hypothetical protein
MTFTREQLERKIRQRVKAATRKRLPEKVGEAGRHFFDDHRHFRGYTGAELRTLTAFDQTSCTTAWDWEITVPIAWASKNDDGWRVSEAKKWIILQYGFSHWGHSEASVKLKTRTMVPNEGVSLSNAAYFPEWVQRDSFVTVLEARGVSDEEKKEPQADANGEWYYETYVPGPWERLLDGPKLEEAIERHRQAEVRLVRQQQARHERELKKSPAPAEHVKEAGKRYGI